ncbi:mitochondrial ribosomal protein L4, isoform CRA_b, partial [Mus musculus]
QAASRASLRLSGSRVIHSLAEGAERPAEISEPRDSAGLLDPVLRKCELRIPVHRRPVQAWVESLRGFEQERIGLAELHPDVFATAPRLDIVHQVAIWQRNFRRISYANTKTRAEVSGGGRKPWQQKGSGRARHGSIRSPLWRGGEWATEERVSDDPCHAGTHHCRDRGHLGPQLISPLGHERPAPPSLVYVGKP